MLVDDRFELFVLDQLSATNEAIRAQNSTFFDEPGQHQNEHEKTNTDADQDVIESGLNEVFGAAVDDRIRKHFRGGHYDIWLTPDLDQHLSVAVPGHDVHTRHFPDGEHVAISPVGLPVGVAERDSRCDRHAEQKHA